MTDRLTPFGSADTAYNLSKVGKSKTPMSLLGRMPSREVASKVGGSSVGQILERPAVRTRRVVRLKTAAE